MSPAKIENLRSQNLRREVEQSQFTTPFSLDKFLFPTLPDFNLLSFLEKIKPSPLNTKRLLFLRFSDEFKEDYLRGTFLGKFQPWRGNMIGSGQLYEQATVRNLKMVDGVVIFSDNEQLRNLSEVLENITENLKKGGHVWILEEAEPVGFSEEGRQERMTFLESCNFVSRKVVSIPREPFLLVYGRKIKERANYLSF